MIKTSRFIALGIALSGALITSSASASLISVTGPLSSTGTAAEIIAAPDNILDDVVTNLAQQGFDEAQGVLTSVDFGIDGGGIISAGTLVDSHMIFLNSAGGTDITHFNVQWTFDGTILGVMSDSGGTLESASTSELGAPGTNYTTPFPGSGPAAPFPARGLEGGGDGYVISGNVLTLSMHVTEPGDWIRVVTAATPVPEPATLTLMLLGLAGLGFSGVHRKSS